MFVPARSSRIRLLQCWRTFFFLLFMFMEQVNIWERGGESKMSQRCFFHFEEGRKKKEITCSFYVFPLVQSGRIADGGGKQQQQKSAGPECECGRCCRQRCVAFDCVFSRAPERFRSPWLLSCRSPLSTIAAAAAASSANRRYWLPTDFPRSHGFGNLLLN